MKNLGYIKKYLFQHRNKNFYFDYFLIEELINNKDLKIDKILNSFEKKHDSNVDSKTVRNKELEESLARLSEKEIIKIDNSTVIANFELYPESLTSSILWMVDKFFEYLYQVTNESNQFEYEDITNQFEYEDVVNYLRIVHSDDDLHSLGKVLYRNSNAIMWILGHLLESKNKGKTILTKNNAINLQGMDNSPSTWAQWSRYISDFGFNESNNSTEIKLNSNGYELLNYVEENYEVEELKSWSDASFIPDKIREIYKDKIINLDVNLPTGTPNSFTSISKMFYIFLLMAQKGDFFKKTQNSENTPKQESLVKNYFNWDVNEPRKKDIGWVAWWGRLLEGLELVRQDQNKYVLTESGNLIIESINSKFSKDKKFIEFMTKNSQFHNDSFEFHFNDSLSVSQEDIERFCTTYNIQKEVLKQIVQSLEYGKKQIILTGPPGTGKTYILDKLNDLFQQSEENKEFVQFHPSYGYEDFVEGLVPDTIDGNLSFVNKDGLLKKFLKNNSKKNQFISLHSNYLSNSNLNDERASWFLNEQNDLVKFVDYSIFEHNTSTIPKEFYSFFSLTDEETKINIQLEDGEGNIYDSYIRTASKSRTTPAKLIKWNRDFANFLKNNISIWDEIKKGQTQEKYGLVFIKTEQANNYRIKAGEILENIISQATTTNPNKQDLIESFGESLYVIIDEINRGNLPRIFGELLNLFEYRDEEVTLQYSKSKFSLPSNLYFFGSMNTADRSIKGIDAALRRRFDFIYVEPNYEILNKHLEDKFSEVNNIAKGLNNLNQQLFQDLKDKSYLIGHTFFMSNQEKITIDDFKAIWNRKIYPQLEEYFFDEPEKLSNYKIENFWQLELEKNSFNNEKNTLLEISE